MRKRGKKLLAMMLAMSMTMNVVSMQAFADEPVDGTVTVNNEDGTVSEIATKTETTESSEDKTTTVTITENISGTNNEGEVVSGTIVKVAESISDLTGEVQKTSSSEEGEIKTTGEKEPVAGEDDVTLELKEGETTSAEHTIPSKETTEFDEELGTDVTTTVTGETPREVNGVMGSIETFKGDGKDVPDSSLTSINPDWVGDEVHVHAPEQKLTDEEIKDALKTKPDGYDFLYTGSGEDSQFSVDYGFVKRDENGNIVETASGWGTGTNQFQLMETPNEEALENKDIYTAYCVDMDTTSKIGYWYNIENLEDADYYKNEKAENHIRAIVMNGYWGTSEGKGSLEEMKTMIKDAIRADADALGGLTEKDIDSMTEGEALTATQMAIWTYGSPYDEVNMEAIGGDGWYYVNGNRYWDWGHWSDYAGMENQKDLNDALNRINKVVKYMITLSETEKEAGTTEVITEDKMVKVDSLSMVVEDKANGYEVNTDDNDDNDVYNVSLNFALVVEPNKDKDDLVVKVVRLVTDDQGKTITEEVAKARLAGDSTNDDGSFSTVVYDETTGSYTLSGLELAENAKCEFNLKLEGVQYLEQGVYIYSSEVKNDVPSQTFVGIAEGYKSVDVGMKVDLCFNVKEGTVTETRKWEKKSSWENKDDGGNDNGGNNGGGNDGGGSTTTTTTIPDPVVPLAAADTIEISDNDVPLSDGTVLSIEDAPIPLAVLPMTGDVSVIWMLLSLISGLGLAGVSLADWKKRRQ
ncbi:MAG: Cys-Gln thioester bond-forming surface protein [Lachnospiraceae bacterium]|nr:Cys-Gln thioester bond-forming surface protein [Lachnospiraceae bacterium]